MNTAVHTSPAVATPAAPRLHLTRRGRIVITLLIAVPLAIVGSLFAVNISTATASGESSKATLEYVQVGAGQSLWQLAESIAPGADPRDVVSDILHFNQLDSGDVQPGQRLALPARYSD